MAEWVAFKSLHNSREKWENRKREMRDDEMRQSGVVFILLRGSLYLLKIASNPLPMANHLEKRNGKDDVVKNS
ncbi:hypothetical protein Gotur_001289 [Gossypium turneri]